MRQAILYAVTVLIIIGVFGACQHIAKEQTADSDHPTRQDDTLRYHPISEKHFIQAEQCLATRSYRNAADELHEGILAFRSETGRIKGDDAAKANKAIWSLTRIRSRLKRGEIIHEEELHIAVLNALAIPPANRPRRTPLKREPSIDIKPVAE